MLGDLFNSPLVFAIEIVSLLIAVTIHEASHAFMADRLGDPTAKLMGRLTLNPLAHLDPIGTLLLLFARIGWGKPVPVDPYNLRNPRRDSAIISLAGPTSNLLLAIVLSLIIHLLLVSKYLDMTVYSFIIPVIVMNVALGIFNLFPVSPLDGFKIVEGILPENLVYQWKELEAYGLIFLLILIFPFGNGSILINIIGPIISFVLNLLVPGIGRII